MMLNLQYKRTVYIILGRFSRKEDEGSPAFLCCNRRRKRYGFVYVNRDEHDFKDMNRYKKKSFGWYQKVIATNGESLKE